MRRRGTTSTAPPPAPSPQGRASGERRRENAPPTAYRAYSVIVPSGLIIIASGLSSASVDDVELFTA